jgi:hypothetical protein
MLGPVSQKKDKPQTAKKMLGPVSQKNTSRKPLENVGADFEKINYKPQTARSASESRFASGSFIQGNLTLAFPGANLTSFESTATTPG